MKLPPDGRAKRWAEEAVDYGMLGLKKARAEQHLLHGKKNISRFVIVSSSPVLSGSELVEA